MRILACGLSVVAAVVISFVLLAQAPPYRGFSYLDAYLRGADLHGKDLRGESFQRANLAEANLQDANVSGVSFVDARLDGANLRRTNFTGAYLNYANMRNANLTGAILRGANLLGAKLVAADLAGADLRGAKLSAAILIGANLRGADLRDIRPLHDLRLGNKVPNCVNMEGARYDRTTRWPLNSNPLTLGAVLVRTEEHDGKLPLLTPRSRG